MCAAANEAVRRAGARRLQLLHTPRGGAAAHGSAAYFAMDDATRLYRRRLPGCNVDDCGTDDDGDNEGGNEGGGGGARGQSGRGGGSGGGGSGSGGGGGG
eukprot:2327994-Prymnesium_polylepis.1